MPHLPKNVKITSDHIWTQVYDSAERFQDKSRPVLFLDRDGVIVEEVHYLHKPEDVTLIDGAAELIAIANTNNIAVVVVTNQSGLARGMFGWDEFNAVQERMLELLQESHGAFVDAVFACPYHKTGNSPFCHPDHPARKPNPGMLQQAFSQLNISSKGSWIIGDKASDLMAGKNAHIDGGIHVLTGHGKDEGQSEKSFKCQDQNYAVFEYDQIGDTINFFKKRWEDL